MKQSPSSDQKRIVIVLAVVFVAVCGYFGYTMFLSGSDKQAVVKAPAKAKLGGEDQPPGAGREAAESMGLTDAKTAEEGGKPSAEAETKNKPSSVNVANAKMAEPHRSASRPDGESSLAQMVLDYEYAKRPTPDPFTPRPKNSLSGLLAKMKKQQLPVNRFKPPVRWGSGDGSVKTPPWLNGGAGGDSNPLGSLDIQKVENPYVLTGVILGEKKVAIVRYDGKRYYVSVGDKIGDSVVRGIDVGRLTLRDSSSNLQVVTAGGSKNEKKKEAKNGTDQ